MKILRAPLLIGLLLVTACASQPTNSGPFKVIYDSEPFGSGSEAISPDGKLIASAGKAKGRPATGSSEDNLLRNAESHNLFLTDTETGKEWMASGGALDYLGIEDLHFSPDGSHIAFVSRGGVSTQVFRIHAPNGGLPWQITGHTAYKQEILTPIYSPDGSKIAFSVVDWVKDEQQPPPTKHANPEYQWFEEGHPVGHVGLLPADASEKLPKNLVQGSPLFWSADSRSIYYVGHHGKDRNSQDLWRYDLVTKHDTKIMPYFVANNATHSFDVFVLGKDPATETFFVKDAGGKIGVKKTGDTGNIDPALSKAVESLKADDGEGHKLVSIQPVGRHSLFLSYAGLGQVPFPANYAFQHYQLVEY